MKVKIREHIELISQLAKLNSKEQCYGSQYIWWMRKYNRSFIDEFMAYYTRTVSDVKIYWLLSTILDEAITELKSNNIKGTLVEFLDWPIETLDELLVIKDGKISRLIIN